MQQHPRPRYLVTRYNMHPSVLTVFRNSNGLLGPETKCIIEARAMPSYRISVGSGRGGVVASCGVSTPIINRREKLSFNNINIKYTLTNVATH